MHWDIARPFCRMRRMAGRPGHPSAPGSPLAARGERASGGGPARRRVALLLHPGAHHVALVLFVIRMQACACSLSRPLLPLLPLPRGKGIEDPQFGPSCRLALGMRPPSLLSDRPPMGQLSLAQTQPASRGADGVCSCGSRALMKQGEEGREISSTHLRLACAGTRGHSGGRSQRDRAPLQPCDKTNAGVAPRARSPPQHLMEVVHERGVEVDALPLRLLPPAPPIKQPVPVAGVIDSQVHRGQIPVTNPRSRTLTPSPL